MIILILLKIISIIVFWAVTSYMNVGLFMGVVMSSDSDNIPKEFIIPLILIGLWFLFCYIIFPIGIFFI